MSARWRQAKKAQVEAYRMERTMPGPDVSAYVADQVGTDQITMEGQLAEGRSASDYSPYGSYGSDLNYTTQTGSVGSMGDGTSWYDPDFPGEREVFSAEFNGAVEDELFPDAIPVIRDNIDWTIGGQMGLVNRFPYSTHGPVSSDAVENFALTGEQIVLKTETYARQLYGPVGTSDSSALASLAYIQMQNQYYPNEASQADMVMSV